MFSSRKELSCLAFSTANILCDVPSFGITKQHVTSQNMSKDPVSLNILCRHGVAG